MTKRVYLQFEIFSCIHEVKDDCEGVEYGFNIDSEGKVGFIISNNSIHSTGRMLQFRPTGETINIDGEELEVFKYRRLTYYYTDDRHKYDEAIK